jgi:hypothetical protein
MGCPAIRHPQRNRAGFGQRAVVLGRGGIRATCQLCQAISDDLKRTDIDLQAGSPVQLYEVTKALTEQLNSVINKRDGA